MVLDKIKTLLDDPNFLEFYVTAKKHTYASGGDEKAEILKNGGKRYVFYDGERWPQWRYTDIYHGYNPFFGNETVEEIAGTTPSIWTPIAQMGYSAYANGTKEQIKRMFAFLEKMLQQVSVQNIFGSMSSAYDNDLEYLCNWIRIDPFCINGKKYINIFPFTETRARYTLNFHLCTLR